MKPRPPSAAFTLVETVIAVAIVATVLLALVALLPAGLGQYRAAADEEAEARIAAGITGQLQMMEWDLLATRLGGTGMDFAFDQKGTPAANNADAVYAARARRVATASPLPGDAGTNDWLQRVEIVISRRPRAADRFENPALTSRRVVSLVKMDR